MLSVITKTIKFWCVMSWMTNKLNVYCCLLKNNGQRPIFKKSFFNQSLFVKNNDS